MTETQVKFIELDKQKEEHKKFFEEYNRVASELFDELGEGGHFQDDEGTVYLAEIPSGKFVNFDHKGIVRTRRSDEKKGSLSLTKAKELGYEVK